MPSAFRRWPSILLTISTAHITPTRTPITAAPSNSAARRAAFMRASVTDPADLRVASPALTAPARPSLLGALALALVLAACGGDQRSTLPPAPGRGGAIALRHLTHDPEVYADATIETVGVVVRARIGHMNVYELSGGGGVRVVLEPTSAFRRDAGQRVRVRGIFTVTFAIGYEILASR